MYTERYQSGTFTQTESERERDRLRMLALEEELKRTGMGICFPSEATEWNEVWRIPMDPTSTELRDGDFQRMRLLGVTLSVKESFEGTSYWLELPKYRSRWRGWTRVQMVVYVASILGFLSTFIILLNHVRSIH